jgi:hypothetical protein
MECHIGSTLVARDMWILRESDRDQIEIERGEETFQESLPENRTHSCYAFRCSAGVNEKG